MGRLCSSSLHDGYGNQETTELCLSILLREYHNESLLRSDTTRLVMVHHCRLPRHTSPATTRLDMGRIHPSLAGPYSPNLPNHSLPQYPYSQKRWSTHWNCPSLERGYDASQRPDSTRLETGSTYLPARAEGKYRWTSIYGLQHLSSAGPREQCQAV
jgi:hypothetical protein